MTSESAVMLLPHLPILKHKHEAECALYVDPTLIFILCH